MTEPEGITSARAALDAARGVFAQYEHVAIPECWHAAERVLQARLQRPALTGQALVGEARRAGVISLADAHALIALTALADRSPTAAATEGERIQLREAWMALQHAVPEHTPEHTLENAPAPAPAAAAVVAPSSPSPPWPAGASAAAPPALAVPAAMAPPPPAARRRARWPWGLAALLVIAALGGGLWWFRVGRANHLIATGTAAYRRGAREVAREALVEAAQRYPNDARALVLLGRMSREDGDLPRARRLLTAAVRAAPAHAVAQRELASVMLADAQPELARRFYVHALELDPTDRVAQGFLGCALFRLQRYDEAARWGQRAGPGEWQRCVGPAPAPGAHPHPPTLRP